MSSGKPITSGKETDQPEKQSDGVGRSYECSYCKRGFTNAQALGGHMNIHRKDKTKAKRKTPHEDFTTHKYFAAISSGYHFRAPNPSYLRSSCNRFDMRKDNIVGSLQMMENPLSLRIGPSFHLEDHDHVSVEERKTNIIMDAEIDLELHL